MDIVMAVKELRIVRGGREILNIEELSIERGEVLAVVGPNGAGKSSLLLALAFLEPPTTGTIQFDGQVAQNGNLLSLRRRTALVFQEATLLDTTVERNLKVALRIRGVSGRDADARVSRWLNRFGVLHLAHRQARRLSGGESQRVSLARAFALEPEILFLDEPFAAVDYPTRKALLSELSALLGEMATTTIFVTHDYTEIPYLSRKVVVIYEGKILKNGLVSDIFGDELTRERQPAPWDV